MSRYHFLAAVFVLCLPALLHAQYNPLSRRSQLGRQPVGLQPVEVSGTIQGVARNGIVVSNGNNQLWKVAIVAPSKINVGTKLQVTGTATVNNLRSGLIVELSADIDNRNTIQGKIDALTITSITREKPMGVFPDADSGFGGNDADKSVKRSAHAKSGKAGRGQIVGRCRIVGRLVVGRGGSMSVQPGRGTLSFELAETPKISVDMADLSLVRAGQEVSVKGFASPRQPNMVQASKVKIKLPDAPDADKAQKTEKAEKKEAAAKPDAKKSEKDPKKDKGEGLPEPGDSK